MNELTTRKYKWNPIALLVVSYWYRLVEVSKAPISAQISSDWYQPVSESPKQSDLNFNNNITSVSICQPMGLITASTGDDDDNSLFLNLNVNLNIRLRVNLLFMARNLIYFLEILFNTTV